MVQILFKSFLLALAIVSLSNAYNSYCFFSDVRNWSRWDAYIKTADVKMTIDGAAARGELTLVFKDTLSLAITDSIELYCQLPLPSGAVVDSLYLWVGEERVTGLILRKWHAWQIYSDAVGRRRDPALLVQNSFGGAYDLRVFPFKRGQERMVRICFTMPASLTGDEFSFVLPLAWAAYLPLPIASVSANISVLNTPSTDVMIASKGTLSEEKDNFSPGLSSLTANRISGTTAHIVLAGNRCAIKTPPSIYVKNSNFDRSGLQVQISKRGDGDPAFLALMHPGKITNLVQNCHRTIILVWNMVAQTYNSTYNYNAGYYAYSYYLTTQFNYSYTIDEELNAIDAFLRANTSAQDRINLFMNDGAIRAYGTSPVTATAAAIDSISSFCSTVSRTSRSDKLPTLSDELKQALTSSADLDSCIFVVVDRTYGYDYRWGAEFTKAVDSVMSTLAPLVKPGMQVNAVYYPYSRSLGSETINRLAAKTNGQALSYYAYNYYWYQNSITGALSELGASISPRFYPASIEITTRDASSYAYEVFEPQNGRYTVLQPVLIMGRLHNASSLKFGFTGTIGDRDYTARGQTFVLNSLPQAVNLDILWAYRKTAALATGQQYTAPDYQAATDFSLEYHILTPYSALLAPEPGMNIVLDQEEQQANGNAVPVIQSAKPSGQVSLAMSVEKLGNAFSISIKGLSTIQNTSLKIYDLKGRLIVDLTNKLRTGDFSVNWNPDRLGRGTYIVRLQSGKQVLTAKIQLTI